MTSQTIAHPGNPARTVVERLLGLAWTRNLRVPALSAIALLAAMVSGGIQALVTPAWPGSNDPALEPAGSPGVIRNGDRFEFIGTVPWTGRQKVGGRAILFGDSAGQPAPAAPYIHYTSNGIVVREKTSVETVQPVEAERRARMVAFALVLTQSFIFGVLFLFVVRLMLRARRFDIPFPGQLALLARAFIPATLVSGVVAAVVPQSLSALVPQFVLAGLFSANVLLVTSNPELRTPVPSGPSFQV